MTKREPYNKPIPRFMKVDVLDEIRAEITKVTYDMSEIDGEHFDEPCLVVDLKDVLEIIDKYSGVKE